MLLEVHSVSPLKKQKKWKIFDWWLYHLLKLYLECNQSKSHDFYIQNTKNKRNENKNNNNKIERQKLMFIEERNRNSNERWNFHL